MILRRCSGRSRYKIMKNILITIASVYIFLSTATSVSAAWPTTADPSAFPKFREIIVDKRVLTLEAVLNSYASPLAHEAKNFVFYADKYQLDWKLVAAIAGVESIFGKHVPNNSYNAWGWAVYTGKQDGRHFTSWEHGIAVVSEGLRKKYLDKGASTVEQIGRTYAVSTAWPNHVRFFLKKIEEYNPTSSRSLAIEL